VEPRERVELSTCRLRISLRFPNLFLLRLFSLASSLLFRAWSGVELATQLAQGFRHRNYLSLAYSVFAAMRIGSHFPHRLSASSSDQE
jgi:hypothetical protein